MLTGVVVIQNADHPDKVRGCRRVPMVLRLGCLCEKVMETYDCSVRMMFMEDLEFSDFHCLQAAEGWLQLGNHVEADAELDRIKPELQARPEVLRLRFHIHSLAKNWRLAFDIARTLTELTPDDPRAWTNQSYTLHEMKRTQEARDHLLGVLTVFPHNSMLRYNLACYECQLGNLQRARELLKEAFDLLGGQALRAGALNDPDLASFKQQLGLT